MKNKICPETQKQCVTVGCSENICSYQEVAKHADGQFRGIEAKAYAPVPGKEEMYNMLVYARKELNLLLQDEDLDDRKLREASEDLLPSLHDKINSLILSFSPSTKQSNESLIQQAHDKAQYE